MDSIARRGGGREGVRGVGMPYTGAPEHIEKSVKTVLEELNGLSYEDAKTILGLVELTLTVVSTVNFPNEAEKVSADTL